MDLRTLALNIGACGALALAGCDGGGGGGGGGTGVEFPERDFVCAEGAAEPCATTVPVRSASDRTRESGTELSNETRVFVLNQITIPRAAMGRIAGFNLDSLDSGEGVDDAETCEGQEPDYVSSADPAQVGVDNAFGASVAPLLGGALMTDLDATILEQVNSGSLLLMMEVSGIDSLRFDSQVSLQLLLGELPEGTTPMLDGTGALAAGQTFTVAQTLGPAVQGDIFDGRLRGTAASLTLALEVMEMNFSLEISQPQIRFDITETGLSNGVIGGFITVQSIIDTLMSIPSLAEFAGPAASILGMYADLQPSDDNPSTCRAISIGLAFGATTAVAQR